MNFKHILRCRRTVIMQMARALVSYSIAVGPDIRLTGRRLVIPVHCIRTQDARVQQTHEKGEQVRVLSQEGFMKFTQHGHCGVSYNVVEHRVEKPAPCPGYGRCA